MSLFKLHIGEGFFVKSLGVPQGVAKLAGDFRPCTKTQIPLLQKQAVFGVVHGVDDGGDFNLQIYQTVDFIVDFMLKVNDFYNGVFHRRSAVIGAVGHPGHNGCTLGGKTVKGIHLRDEGVDALIQMVCLGEVLFCSHTATAFPYTSFWILSIRASASKLVSISNQPERKKCSHSFFQARASLFRELERSAFRAWA
nr:MAG TPA: hypothetical protein [Caudoviricetes sp.]